MNRELVASARRALGEYLKVTPGEKTLVVHDGGVMNIVAALELAASELRITLTLRKITPTGGNGREPDAETAKLMATHQVVLCPTRFSLTHTNATRAACLAKARVATLPGITDELFAAGLQADPLELRTAGEAWVARMKKTRLVRIRTAAGTDLTFAIGQYPAHSDDGCLDQPGACGNLPAGEAYVAPDLGSATGKVVFDGSISGQGWKPGDLPATVSIRKGAAVDFGGDRGERLEKALLTAGDRGRILAEFGIGTHPTLTLSGHLLGDEKLKGTVHIAFGNNCSMGGDNNVPVHLDGLILQPDVDFDGQPVIQQGEWLPLS